MTAQGRAVMAAESGREGFTLIEVLVAFVVFAGSLGLLLQLFSGSLRQSNVSDGYSRATQLAESRLAAVGIVETIETGERNGRFDERFRWTLVTQPYAEESANFETLSIRPYRVTVTVSWEEGDGARSISLAKLRLAASD